MSFSSAFSLFHRWLFAFVFIWLGFQTTCCVSGNARSSTMPSSAVGFSDIPRHFFTDRQLREAERNRCFSLPPFNYHQTPRIITYSIDPLFRQDRLQSVRKGFAILQEYGFSFQEINSQQTANIIPQLFIQNRSFSNSSQLIGFYVPRTNIIQINSSRNMFEVTNLIVHEFGHWLGMGHVCLTETELDSDGSPIICSPVGFGSATMNPRVLNDTYATITSLDRLELHRVNTCRSLFAVALRNSQNGF